MCHHEQFGVAVSNDEEKMKVEWEDDDRCVVIANSTISNAMTFHWVESPDDKDLKEGDWALSACLFMQNDPKADPDPTLFK